MDMSFESLTPALQETVLAIYRSRALRIANGRWQARTMSIGANKNFLIWCLITPRGKLIMHGNANEMRRMAFRLAARPF
jgi:hypothetical protein